MDGPELANKEYEPTDFGPNWLSLMLDSAQEAYNLSNFSVQLRHASDDEFEQMQKIRSKLERINGSLLQLRDHWVEISFLDSEKDPVKGTFDQINPSEITCSVKPLYDKLQVITYGLLQINPDNVASVEPTISLKSFHQFEYDNQ